MATILGGITTSHIPAIGKALQGGHENDPDWKPFFDGYQPVRRWLNEVRPDVAIVVYNDHGLNFFLDQIPTFAIGAAAEYPNSDSGWGLAEGPVAKGNPELSWHLIESLVHSEFDLTMCQEMKVDHGFMVPMSVLWPHATEWPLQVVPLAVNTVQHPLPSPARCYKLGQALGDAIRSYPDDVKVVVIGTGGMSHQLQGERAGLINKSFDLMFLDAIVSHPDALARLSVRDVVEAAGSEGVELIMWLVMRGAIGDAVSSVHSHYHVPVSSTGAGVLLLETPAGALEKTRTISALTSV